MLSSCFNLIISVGTEDGGTHRKEKRALLLALKNATIPRLLAKDAPTAYVLLWDLFHIDSSAQHDEEYTILNASGKSIIG